jgi:hypothetical protein
LEEAAGERVGRGAMGLDDEIAAVQQEKKRREAELLARGAEQEDDLMGAPADKYSGFETSIAVDDDDQGADEREQGLAAYAPPRGAEIMQQRMWTAGERRRAARVGPVQWDELAVIVPIQRVSPHPRCR